MSGYIYTVNNKKGKTVDFWVMDKPTPKEATVIMSCRFSQYIKPTRKRFEALINDTVNQKLKSERWVMKRVIDVSTTTYEACKRLEKGGDARPSEVCIANSEPYEPQGTSKWIYDSDNLPICQECGEIALQRIFVKMPHLIQDVRMVRSNYCPNCGRKMEGDTI